MAREEHFSDRILTTEPVKHDLGNRYICLSVFTDHKSIVEFCLNRYQGAALAIATSPLVHTGCCWRVGTLAASFTVVKNRGRRKPVS